MYRWSKIVNTQIANGAHNTREGCTLSSSKIRKEKKDANDMHERSSHSISELRKDKRHANDTWERCTRSKSEICVWCTHILRACTERPLHYELSTLRLYISGGGRTEVKDSFMMLQCRIHSVVLLQEAELEKLRMSAKPMFPPAFGAFPLGLPARPGVPPQYPLYANPAAVGWVVTAKRLHNTFHEIPPRMLNGILVWVDYSPPAPPTAVYQSAIRGYGLLFRPSVVL